MVNKEEELLKIEEYAKINNVPIMQKDGIEFLTNFIKENNIKNILEIGAAIGFSAIKMALTDENIKITTIEKDEVRYLEALKNIKTFNLENRITLMFQDASNVNLEEEYDLIFIDAAKAQNKNFFLHFEKNLKSEGYIITDNLNFHGLVKQNIEEIESKNLRALVRKIKDYIDFLEENEEYETKFNEIGDGISISKRKKDRNGKPKEPRIQ